MTYHRFVTRLTRRVPLVEKELLILPKHMSSPPVFSGVRVTRSLVLYVYFADRRLSFVLFLLAILSFFGLWILITPLVSSNSSSTKHYTGNSRFSDTNPTNNRKSERVSSSWFTSSTCDVTIVIARETSYTSRLPGADPGFQVRGRTQKNCAERREARTFLGYFVWKFTILRQKSRLQNLPPTPNLQF